MLKIIPFQERVDVGLGSLKVRLRGGGGGWSVEEGSVISKKRKVILLGSTWNISQKARAAGVPREASTIKGVLWTQCGLRESQGPPGQ